MAYVYAVHAYTYHNVLYILNLHSAAHSCNHLVAQYSIVYLCTYYIPT